MSNSEIYDFFKAYVGVDILVKAFLYIKELDSDVLNPKDMVLVAVEITEDFEAAKRLILDWSLESK